MGKSAWLASGAALAKASVCIHFGQQQSRHSHATKTKCGASWRAALRSSGGLQCCALRFVVLATAIAAFAGIRALAAARPSHRAYRRSIDPFGQEVDARRKSRSSTSPARVNWDSAYDDADRGVQDRLQAYLDKAGIKAAGPAMTIYTAMDDMSFNFQAVDPGRRDSQMPRHRQYRDRHSPGGKVLKFVHRGSFDAMTADLRFDRALSSTKSRSRRRNF